MFPTCKYYLSLVHEYNCTGSWKYLMRLKFPLPFPLLTLDCEKFILCINITQKIFVTVICYLARKGIIVCGLGWSVFDHWYTSSSLRQRRNLALGFRNFQVRENIGNINSNTALVSPGGFLCKLQKISVFIDSLFNLHESFHLGSVTRDWD